MTAPTVGQMRARCLSGHWSALAAISEGRPVLGPNAFASEIRGMRKVLSTLRRWGAIDETGITDRGRALLASREVES